MKKTILLFTIACFSLAALAQNWLSSTPGNIYYDQGNVGIGISSPTEKLQVNGSLLISNGSWKHPLIQPGRAATAGNVGYSFYGDTDTGMFNPNIDNTISFATGGEERLRIDASGNVGIGTTLPSANLEVKGLSDVALLTVIENNSSTRRRINIGAKNDEVYIQHLYGTSSVPFNFKVSGTNVMTLHGSNVGIGKVAPHFALDVSRANHNVARFTSTGTNSGADVLIVDQDNNNVRASLQVQGNAGSIESLFVSSSGNVGIGSVNPQSKLAVNGQIRATEVKVLADVSVPDYVFDLNYELRTLKETKEYIAENKHLPEIPSASQIAENGIDLGDMNMRLLKKIEELTLYQIELLERLEKAENEISELKNK